MARKPILIFPVAKVVVRNGLPSAVIPPKPRPNQAEQKLRLTSRFRSMIRQFGSIQTGVNGIDPEQVIVLETIGSVSDFQNVVKKIPGMEWLGDFDANIAEPDPGFFANGEDRTQLFGHLFVIASNRNAYSTLLKLWRAWSNSTDEKLAHGYGALAEVFKHLQDVREWSPKDRIAATGVVESWEKGLASNEPNIRFEAELWCRAEQADRDVAYNNLQAAITEVGGQCITQANIPEIDYHGVLLELPAGAVRQTIDSIRADNATKLLRLTDVKYFAPMGQASIATIDEGASVLPAQKPIPAGDAVAALLDGLPLTNHSALQDRLIVDDPDNFSGLYQIGEHRHGTAMASLIAHGELDAGEPALLSKLYVRPLMHPGRADINNKRWEVFPSNQLPVDLVHRAVKRIFEGDGDGAAKAPNVKIINLSVGDSAQLFDRHLSPWAKLLDWLSWKYKVLFIVSAGNHLHEIEIPVPPESIANTSDNDLRSHAIQALAKQKVQRRLLAPAESVNALTVGALHSQKSPLGDVPRLVDLLRGAAIPSLINPISSGFRRSIKPEIFVDGGKRHYEPVIHQAGDTNTKFNIINAVSQPGQLVAASGGTAIPPSNATRICGTSNAAALTTRQAIKLYEEIMQLREENGGAILSDDKIAVVIKAMLVHGAEWGDSQSFMDQIFGGTDRGLDRWHKVKRICGQFMGYGAADFEKGTVCTDQRVIVLGCGELKEDEGHIYNIPLPPALNAQVIKRRLAITLTWLTPVNPKHRNYSVADLWFVPPETQLQVKRSEVSHSAVKQGTVQHEILEGELAVPISEGDLLPIQVNCRKDAGKFPSPIPYALMVSLETARALPVSLYDQVSLRLDQIREEARIRPIV